MLREMQAHRRQKRPPKGSATKLFSPRETDIFTDTIENIGVDRKITTNNNFMLQCYQIYRFCIVNVFLLWQMLIMQFANF